MNVYIEITLIILLATVIAGIMRVLKQPLIMGYILAGILVGPYFLGIFAHKETVETFSQMGIAILLFIVGLNLSPKVIREVGKVSIVTGFGQVLFTALIAYLLVLLLGFPTRTAFYISIALTFSSTIIITKLISDKRDTEKLYSRIAVGILLIQDLVATTLLVFVSAFSNSQNAINLAVTTALKGILITLVLTYISSVVLPRLSHFFAKSQEYLFLFSIAWGFGMAALFSAIGFSIEIGSLIAGVTLSVSPFSQEIASKLKPLRDFFIIMFFISLGSNLALNDIGSIAIPAIVLSVFVLIGKPLLVMILMGFAGYNKKTGFLAGISLAQISEFSLILILLTAKIGHVETNILSLVTIVALVSIAGSTYFILYGDNIFYKLAPYLSIFERKHVVKEVEYLGSYEVVLFGCNRVGYDFIKEFEKLGPSFLAVDFNPDIVKELKKLGVNCRYGDAEDGEFLEELGLENIKIIVSTIPDFDANSYLLSKTLKANKEAIVILISYNVDEAIKLYDMGAVYVILPHFIGGQFATDLASRSGYDYKKMYKERDKHIQYLKERKALGHSHPHWKHHI